MSSLREYPTVEEAVANAEHYLALGQTEIWLGHRSEVDRPWHLVTSMREGGSHRLDICTSVNFIAEHESGLQFRWSIDVEEEGSNGISAYKLNFPLVAQIVAALPEAPREQFRAYLSDCADKVEARGREFMDAATKQFGDAVAFRQLASTPAEAQQ